jgi:hypothetical protein
VCATTVTSCRSSRFRQRLRRVAELPPQTLLAEVSWRLLRAGLRGADEVYSRARRSHMSAPHPFAPFLLPPRLPPLESLPEEARANCIAEANSALEGRFNILGLGSVNFGSPPRWHSDPRHGYDWPLEQHSKLGAKPGRADIKVPWEASRLLWLVALARAKRYTGDRRYLIGASELLRDWEARNPVGYGPNWVTPMEIGIRVVNLVWAAEIFGEEEFSARVGGLIQGHAWHLLRNLEYTPALTSNHYLGNITGLCYAGAALRHTCAGWLWLRVASRMLNREILKQFLSDGANFEASTGYHRVSAELCLLSLIALQRVGENVDTTARDRLRQALLALDLMAGPCELVPAIGDDDSGLIVGLVTDRHPRDGRVLTASGLGFLDDSDAGDPQPDEFAYWLLGRYVPRRPYVLSGSLPKAGIYTFTNGQIWCLADCGGVGQRGNGGHAHNDTLSFVLAVGGVPVITDSGSGNYTGNPRMRNLLRSVRAHATICVDDAEINRFDPALLFTMRDEDDPSVEVVEMGTDRCTISASHRGYTRLPDPVVHRRRWDLDRGGLTITDTLDCVGSHRAELCLPLSPEAEAILGEDRVAVRLRDTTLHIVKVRGGPTVWTIEKQPYADRYGQTVESPVLRGDIVVNGSTSWSLRLSVKGLIDQEGTS